jgi:hypothetical protein
MTRLDFAETTSTHIYEIVSDASEVTKREIHNCGTTAWQLIRDLRNSLSSSKAVTLLADGEPVFVFGHSPGTIHKSRMTWFVAKQRYFELGVRGVLAARRYLKTVKNCYPGVTFESYSYSDHKDVQRWFELLGFARQWPFSVPANCRVFHLTAAAKKDDLPRVSC